MVEIKNPMWFSCHRSGGSQERSLGTVLEEEQKAGSGPHIQPQSLIFKKLLKLDQNWIYRLKKASSKRMRTRSGSIRIPYFDPKCKEKSSQQYKTMKCWIANYLVSKSKMV